jgi:DNA-binding FadR family transcriptional regulator
MIVEPAAAALAAERRTAEDIAQMEAALDEMERRGLASEAGRAADQAFHTAILEAARNGPLLALSSSIAAAVTWTTIYKHRRRGIPRDPMPDHRALHETIVAGDPVAARGAMTDLVRLALADTEPSMKP